jgi:hypothetical protein
MATMYCALCNRPVEANRQIGAGTVILAVFTAGLSLLAIPFYHRRCSICKSTALHATPAEAEARGATGSVARIAELERRLGLVENELEAANVELRRLTAERDFYSQLLSDPNRRGTTREPGT